MMSGAIGKILWYTFLTVLIIICIFVFAQYKDRHDQSLLGVDGNKCIFGADEGKAGSDEVIKNCSSFLLSSRADVLWTEAALFNRSLAYLGKGDCISALEDANSRYEFAPDEVGRKLKALAFECAGNRDKAFLYVTAMINDAPKCYKTMALYGIRARLWKARGEKQLAERDEAMEITIKNSSLSYRVFGDFFTCTLPLISPIIDKLHLR
jgi:hypothetical protein